MTNQEIADIFELLAKLMDIHGENSFKTKTYSTAAFKLEKLPQPLNAMLPEAIRSIAGIGDAVTAKIIEILETGKLQVLDQYLHKTPAGIVEMLNIKGLGPKKIAVLWKELDIESIGELEYACNENRLITLKGFGEKTQASILKSILFLNQNRGFYLWAEAEAIAVQITQTLSTQFPDAHLSVSGLYRRQWTSLSVIDWVTTIQPEQLTTVFAAVTDVQILQEQDKVTVTLPNSPVLCFTITTNTAYFKKLFTESSTPEFLVAFEAKYPLPNELNSEAEIFSQHQLPFIPPALRESAHVLQPKQLERVAHLIQPTDIKGIIHNHSTWSDGLNTLEEMAIATRDKGFEYLVISDHSQAAFYANGLSPERIQAQHAEINMLNQKLAPFKIFKSIEADILHDGSLDYNDEILASFDIVIASVHSNLKMTEEKAMQRLLTAIQNPHTRILGHPTGRLLLSREGYPVDYKTLIDACVAHKVVIEINAHPRRLDLDWRWLPYALEQGAMLSINPDAHSIAGIDLVKYGVLAAQKGGLTAQDNLSSMSLTAFEQFVANKR